MNQRASAVYHGHRLVAALDVAKLRAPQLKPKADPDGLDVCFLHRPVAVELCELAGVAGAAADRRPCAAKHRPRSLRIWIQNSAATEVLFIVCVHAETQQADLGTRVLSHSYGVKLSVKLVKKSSALRAPPGRSRLSITSRPTSAADTTKHGITECPGDQDYAMRVARKHRMTAEHRN